MCFLQVSLNAWFWSTVFHTRDTYLTEVMVVDRLGFIKSYDKYFNQEFCSSLSGLYKMNNLSPFGLVHLLLTKTSVQPACYLFKGLVRAVRTRHAHMGQSDEQGTAKRDIFT